MSRSLFFIAAFIYGLLTESTVGGVIVADEFSYPDGPLVVVSDGIWKTHSGTAGQAEVFSGQLRLSQKLSEDVSVGLGAGFSPTNAPPLFASMTVSFSAFPTGVSGTYFAHFKDASLTTGIRCRFFATTNGAAPGQFRLGISAGSNAPTALWPHDLELQVPYRLVCQWVLSNASATLWINPLGETDPSITAPDHAAPKSVTAFAFRQSLSSGTGIGELAVDHLVISTKFEEALLGGAPSVERAPVAQTLRSGDPLRMEVVATGSEPLAFQWLCNGESLPGAITSTLMFPRVTEANAGEYSVIISNAFGSVTTTPVTVDIVPPPWSVAIAAGPNATVRLTWRAVAGQSYSVWTKSVDTHELALVAEGLFFTDELGFYDEASIVMPARFYQVCSDWEVP